MMLRAWRIIKAKHAATAFSGGGAKVNGGRWNSPGTAMVYTAGSTSLAILEMLVHLQNQDLIQRYVIFEVTFDGSLVMAIDPGKLPKTWRRSPASRTVQQVGDEWVASGSSAVLRLPSVIVPIEWNYLLNPVHPDFPQITIGPKQPIKFDPRLVKAPTP
jgi:RES domain-containing protein